MKISDANALGIYIRNARKAQNLTLEEVATACGVGKRFLGELERGKSTCQTGKLFMVLNVLGIKVELVSKTGINNNAQ